MWWIHVEGGGSATVQQRGAAGEPTLRRAHHDRTGKIWGLCVVVQRGVFEQPTLCSEGARDPETASPTT